MLSVLLAIQKPRYRLRHPEAHTKRLGYKNFFFVLFVSFVATLFFFVSFVVQKRSNRLILTMKARVASCGNPRTSVFRSSL
jgi:hypothetical protein